MRLLLKLAYEYECDVTLLTERIKFIRKEIAKKPPPGELQDLKMRLDTLYAERREMRQTIARLRWLALPKTPSPSLAQKEREARYGERH